MLVGLPFIMRYLICSVVGLNFTRKLLFRVLLVCMIHISLVYHKVYQSNDISVLSTVDTHNGQRISRLYRYRVQCDSGWTNYVRNWLLERLRRFNLWVLLSLLWKMELIENIYENNIKYISPIYAIVVLLRAVAMDKVKIIIIFIIKDRPIVSMSNPVCLPQLTS